MKNSKYIQQIRDRLSEYLENPGSGIEKVSINAAARSIGVSNSRLSQFLNDKYTGDNKTLADQIASWLRRQAERAGHDAILTETIMTRAVKKIVNIARICHIQAEMGVATGDAGVGKTRGVKYYAAQNPDVILIEVMPGLTTKTLMGELHKAAGYNGKGRIYDMFTDVVDRLKGSGRMIIIDEAETLPYSAHELLRRFYDIAGIGVLLVGMPELIANLRGNKGEYKQLYSRIGVHGRIPSMKETPKDVQAIVASALPGSNGVWKHFYEATYNGRQLEKLLKRSIQLAEHNGVEVSAEVVSEAKKYIII